MEFKRSKWWSAARKRRAARTRAVPAPESVPAPTPEPVHQDDLLKTVSNAAWRLLVIGVVVALLLWGAIYIRVVVLPIILAIFATALLMPVANWLRSKGMGRGTATAITVLGALIAFGGVVTIVVMPAVSGFNSIATSVNQAVVTLQDFAASLGLNDRLVSDWVASAQAEIQRNSSQLVSGTWAVAVGVGEVLIGVILVLVLTVYFVHSGDELMKWVRELFPQPSRRAIQIAGEVSYDVMGRYVRGVALVGLFDAIGIGIVLLFCLDPTLAWPLIVLTFIGAFLPVIGAFLTGLISVLVGLVAEGWIVALIILAGTVAVQQLESHVFAPRVYGKALELPSAVVLLAIAIGSIIGGITGAFLATPVAAVLAALLRNRPFAIAEAQVLGASAPSVPSPQGTAAPAAPAAPAASPAPTTRPATSPPPAADG
ncbi:AI-2E family transporter [Nocardiopsis ansamitocini]|uniref:AI-2E family transporter n=1 Tax=Nocardiopsis ansamitocini TaxID=1670832 RepID=A0A9W6P864_9ACTN|nr:AI-2E family transporter [Nocardiopsis ansamitocini]GLU48945.1 AI-2E family transporter [Nocardiopsis ansamitocini]